MYRAKCKKCSGKKFWKVRRGKLRTMKLKPQIITAIRPKVAKKQDFLGSTI